LQYTPIEKLSGGERRRLLLLKVLVTQPNFLVLDEPTNDLDLDTLSVLEDYLETFPGCLLMVTHDRYFMDRLTDHLFVFKGNGQIQDYNGNYSDWREEQKELKPEEKKTGNAPAPSTESVKNSSPSSKRKLSYKEQKELSDLEVQIAQLESLKNGLIESLERGGNLDEITRISAEIANVDQEIESKTFRWLELSE
jgi:ATP-binding cassette subfamily F protein uup